jgi:hypothetical protein
VNRRRLPANSRSTGAASRRRTASRDNGKASLAAQGHDIIGWREWIGLPQLGEAAIKAKIDTGARSSSLHAYGVETFRRRGVLWVRFQIHPRQRSLEPSIPCEARVLEFRAVRSSSGHLSQRPVIVTDIELHGRRWPIELTLANRDEMGFRMLLGREALRGRLVVDPARSYLAGRPDK